MPTYYISNLNFNINKIKNLNLELDHFTDNIILTENSLIKIINDQYWKFSVIERNPSKIFENFIQDKNLYIDYSYFKKNCIINHIPLEHKFIQIEYLKFKLSKKSKTFFVIELIDNIISNYYFTSNEKIDIIQNEIFSFLRRLN